MQADNGKKAIQAAFKVLTLPDINIGEGQLVCPCPTAAGLPLPNCRWPAPAQLPPLPWCCVPMPCRDEHRGLPPRCPSSGGGALPLPGCSSAPLLCRRRLPVASSTPAAAAPSSIQAAARRPFSPAPPSNRRRLHEPSGSGGSPISPRRRRQPHQSPAPSPACPPPRRQPRQSTAPTPSCPLPRRQPQQSTAPRCPSSAAASAPAPAASSPGQRARVLGHLVPQCGAYAVCGLCCACVVPGVLVRCFIQPGRRADLLCEQQVRSSAVRLAGPVPHQIDALSGCSPALILSFLSPAPAPPPIPCSCWTTSPRSSK